MLIIPVPEEVGKSLDGLKLPSSGTDDTEGGQCFASIAVITIRWRHQDLLQSAFAEHYLACKSCFLIFGTDLFSDPSEEVFSEMLQYDNED